MENFTSISCLNNDNLHFQGDYIRACQVSGFRSIVDFAKSCDYNNLQKDHNTILSASMLGAHVTVDGQSIESYFDDDVHILKYCLARIDEIEAINKFSHSPSAYGCILSFLAFLGQATHNATNYEEEHFKKYCEKHMLRLRCKRVERIESGTTPIGRSRSNDIAIP